MSTENTDGKCHAHLDKRLNELETLVRSGFPDGNLLKHKELHEMHLLEEKERKAFWKDFKYRILQGGLWSATLFVALAVWEYIKVEVRK